MIQNYRLVCASSISNPYLPAYSSQPRYPNDTTGIFGQYQVQSGDILNNIGRKLGVSYEFLNMLRGRKGLGVEDDGLRPGDTLKIVNAKRPVILFISIRVISPSISTLPIFLLSVTLLVTVRSKPQRQLVPPIDSREKEMDWYDPKTNEAIPYGDPRHLIGPVWMRFNGDSLGQSGLGIHGFTGEGPSTNALVSNDCIRMANEDAREVYNILVPCVMSRNDGFITRAPMTVTIVD